MMGDGVVLLALDAEPTLVNRAIRIALDLPDPVVLHPDQNPAPAVAGPADRADDSSSHVFPPPEDRPGFER